MGKSVFAGDTSEEAIRLRSLSRKRPRNTEKRGTRQGRCPGMLGRIQVRGTFVNVDVDVHVHVDVFGFFLQSSLPRNSRPRFVHGHVHVYVYELANFAGNLMGQLPESAATF